MSLLIPTYIVDSFTDQPFKGNPAGVCLLTQELSESQMLSIANELGYSETAFVLAEGDQYRIRFFSPKVEIPLCGHATLASSKVMMEKDPSLTNIHFVNIQGLDLNITKEGMSIIMEFPVYDTDSVHVPSDLLDALGIDEIINSVYNEETRIVLLEIEDSELLQSLAPDFGALVDSISDISGVLVTAPSKQAAYDFESRFFWPWDGTDEDPVTGGTHTFLTKYWSERLGKNKMKSFQCSERSGFMDVEITPRNTLLIKSQAQIILEGQIRL
jgi:PhzF family phenazine biosynthesis protein